jgi:DNA (cytosine-5)-methyltransferase 1
MCERDPFCQAVLRKHWPDVPVFEDVRTLKGEDIGASVDVIHGGPPCQPFSVAGEQKGKDDERYLWPEFSRLVGELRPRWVVAENVPGITRIAADDVCSDLERFGYSVGIWSYEAASVGAPQRRARVFFVAHSRRWVCKGRSIEGAFRGEHEEGQAAGVKRSSSSLSPTCNWEWESQPLMGRVVNGFPTWLDGHFWEKEPNMSRVAKGSKGRMNRLKALGNAVVPAQAYPIFKAIMEAERGDFNVN